MIFPLITDILLIVLMLAFCKARIRIHYADCFIFTVEILLLAVTFKFGKQKKKAKRRRRNGFKSIVAISRALISLADHSEIYIDKINASPNSKDPADFVIAKQNYMTAFSIILSYIYSKSEILVLNNDNKGALCVQEQPNALDALLVTPLYSIFLSLFIYKFSKRAV